MQSLRSAGVALAVPLLAWMGCTTSPFDVADSTICTDVARTDVSRPKLWTELHPAASPPGRVYPSTGFDEATDRLVIFGGAADGKYLSDVWLLSDATDTGGKAAWAGLATTGAAPSARSGAASAYDPGSNRLIVAGGAGQTSQLMSDVWVLTNANGIGGMAAWIQLQPAGQGPAVFGASTVYDAASNVLVVFGGQAAAVTSDAFVLSNANGLGGTPAWTKISAGSAPAARELATAVLDTSTSTMLFFGGDGGGAGPYQNRTLFADTWALSPITGAAHAFAPFAASSPPAKRTGQSLLFDPTTKRAILFGGATSAGFDSETHLLSTTGSRTWSYFDTGNAPAARAFHAAAYSAKTNRMVVFGGQTYSNTGGTLADTWVLDHANGAPASPVVKMTASAGQKVCATKTLVLGATGTDAAGNVEDVPVVWSCSDPAVVSEDGRIVGTTPETITCTACVPDGGPCSDPVSVEITAAPAASGGGGSSGGSGSSSGTGGTCPGGFLASERSCAPNDAHQCECQDFPCRACIQSKDFPQANGRALGDGEPGCFDLDSRQMVKPCAPGLCCIIGPECNDTGSHCGKCPVAPMCP